MALAFEAVWEVRVAGNDGNGGAFNPARGGGGVDRSQQNAAQVVVDGAAITATVNATTTDLDLTGYVPSAADLGNHLNITGGTATAGLYEIVAIVSGRWRLDRAAGTAGQTATGNMGGALASPGRAGEFSTAFNTIWVRSGTYSITSATPNIAGGCVSFPAGGQVWLGYATTRGDLGTAPLLQASGITNATIFHLNNNDALGANFEIDGASLTTIRGVLVQGRGCAYKITARNCTNTGIGYNSAAMLVACLATGCTTAGAGINQLANGIAQVQGCVAHTNTVPGFRLGDAGHSYCLSYNNSGGTTDGFLYTTSPSFTLNCVAFGNGRDGFRATASNSPRFVNCLAEGNAGFGFNVTGIILAALIRCGVFNNAGGNVNGTPSLSVDLVTATSTFFTDAAGGDFSLTSAAAGGGLARSTGEPGEFPGGLSEGFLDRGAVQSAGGGGGGGASTGEGPELGGTWG